MRHLIGIAALGACGGVGSPAAPRVETPALPPPLEAIPTAGLDLVLPPSPPAGSYACRYGDRVELAHVALRFEPNGPVFAVVHSGFMELMEIEGAQARIRIATGGATLEGWSSPPLYPQRSLRFAGLLIPYGNTSLDYQALSDDEVLVGFHPDPRVVLVRGAPERLVTCDDLGPLTGAFEPEKLLDRNPFIFEEAHDDAEALAPEAFELAAAPSEPIAAIVSVFDGDDPMPFVRLRRQSASITESTAGREKVAIETENALVIGWTKARTGPGHDLIYLRQEPADAWPPWGRDDSILPPPTDLVCAHYAPLIAEHQGRRMLVGRLDPEAHVTIVGEQGPLVEIDRPSGVYANETRWLAPREHLFSCGALEVAHDHVEGHPPPPHATAASPVACLPTWTGNDARCLGPRNALELALVTVTQAEAALDDGEPRRALSLLENPSHRFDQLDHDVGLRADAIQGHAHILMGRLDAARHHADLAMARWRDLRLLKWWRQVDDSSRRARAASAMGRARFTQAEIARIREVEILGLEPFDAPPTEMAVVAYLRDVAEPYFAARARAIERGEHRYVALIRDRLTPLRWKIAAASAVGRMWNDLSQQALTIPVPSFQRLRYPFLSIGEGRRRAARLSELVGLSTSVAGRAPP